jgi:eukaryotic-like serine/threonine-protein kinase
LPTPIKDEHVLELVGRRLTSTAQPGAHYRLERVLGEGAHGIVFEALCESVSDRGRVAIKILRPRAVRRISALESATVQKELAALSLLSRAPDALHVVRLLDHGTLRLGDSLALPWLAVEYIDGGAEGTTLRARVEHCVATSGFAFGKDRARRALSSVIAGVRSLHAAGVIHRDIAPANVLCTGAGKNEIFKVGDLSLARVSNVGTFGNVLLGTPGYCAPEQSFPDKVGVGPHTDLFGVACVAYFVLTGEPYFLATNIPEMLVAVHGARRRGLAEAAALCPELGDDVAGIKRMDAALATATSADPTRRAAGLEGFAAALTTLAMD